MQKELKQKINYLIEMSGSTSSYDVLLDELDTINKEITLKKEELKSFKKMMVPSKYRNDNERLIDENIKVGLENKRVFYEQELERINTHLEKVRKDEEDIHGTLEQAKKRISSLNALLETLDEKLKVVHQDSTLNTFYENLIDKTIKEVNEEEKKKAILTVRYDKVQEHLLQLSQSRDDDLKFLNDVLGRLEDTKRMLQNPNCYVDFALQSKDDVALAKLNEELDGLEKQRLIYITDPVYIGNEAIKMYDLDDRTSALDSVKELVTIIKSMPYMNVSTDELADLLEQATLKRDEFANEVQNNSYLGEDTKFIDERIEYLENAKDDYDEEIARIESIVNDIDTVKVLNISKYLEEVKEVYTALKEEYEEYRTLVEQSSEQISARKKLSLQNAFKRKKEELDTVYKLMMTYQTELEEMIALSRSYVLNDLESLKVKKDACDEEIKNLKRLKGQGSRGKDILKEEKDKEKLNDLANNVEAIIHRQKYSVSPDDLYDEIDVMVRGGEVKSVEPVINSPKEDFVNLDDFRIEPIIPDFTLEEPEVAPPFKVEEQDAIDPVISLEEPIVLEDNSSLIEEENNPQKRFKVVKMESLTPVNEEPVIDEKIVEALEPEVNDDYISFNDILSGGFKDGN